MCLLNPAILADCNLFTVMPYQAQADFKIFSLFTFEGEGVFFIAVGDQSSADSP
jgi:hypothetical protein